MSLEPAARYEIEADIASLVRDQLTDAKRQSGVKPVVAMHGRAVRRYQMEARVEGHRILCDEPLHGGGSDVAPAPLRYFVAGVVQCVQIWIVKVAAVEQLAVRGLATSAEAYLQPGTVGMEALSATESITTGRGFDRIVLGIDIETDDRTSDADVAAVVRKGVRACPSAVTFARSASLEIVVRHNGRQIVL